MEIPDPILDRFEEVAKQRGDDPKDALERLMLDYIGGNDIVSRLDKIEERLDKAAIGVEDEADDQANQTEPAKVQALSAYDPSDSTPLSRDALDAITDLRHENIEIDPADIDDIPQNVEVKQAVIVACARHEYSVLNRDELAEIADQIIGLNSDYKRDKYLEEPWSRLIENGFDFNKRFTSLSAALSYLDETVRTDEGELRKNKIDQITMALHKEYDVPANRLNEYREQVNIEPL